MPRNRRVLDLLEEMLNTAKTPEQVCIDCPELLPEVQRKWATIRRIDIELDALLPSSIGVSDSPEGSLRPEELPKIPGYDVEGLLGRGGMGIVYRAWHGRLNRPVALKMLLVGPYARQEERGRFLREAQAVAALDHPNIVQVHDAGEADGRPYFTMELVEGGDLAKKIQGIPQPSQQAAALLATLA